MTAAELDQKIEALEKERTAIFEEIAPKQERLQGIYKEIKPLQDARSKLWLEEMGDNPDWRRIVKELAEGPLCSVALGRYVDKHIEQYGLYQGGYDPETQEGAL